MIEKNVITDLQKAYLAGFFDGEGCIAIAHSSLACLTVVVTQKFLPVLELHKELFNAGEIYPINGGSCFQWRLTGRENLRAFLETIYPYCMVKKEVIEYALCWLHQDTHIGVKLTDEEATLRQILIDAIHKCNERQKRMEK